mmetsp:Transcript_12963/g.33088  ORF Transcript_12963/g.33088 Transcript_12963/m.33088 type:complete len:87 (-) Transcript_12963:1263-1523(-)
MAVRWWISSTPSLTGVPSPARPSSKRVLSRHRPSCSSRFQSSSIIYRRICFFHVILHRITDPTLATSLRCLAWLRPYRLKCFTSQV